MKKLGGQNFCANNICLAQSEPVNNKIGNIIDRVSDSDHGDKTGQLA